MFWNMKNLTAMALGAMLTWSSTASASILVKNYSFDADAPTTNIFPADWVATINAKVSAPSGIRVVYLAGLNERVLQALHHDDETPLLWTGENVVYEVTATLGKPTWRQATDNDGVRFVIGQYHNGTYTELASQIISIDHLLSPGVNVFEDFTVTFDSSQFNVAPTPGAQVYIAFIAQKIADGGTNPTTASAYVDNVRVSLVVPEPASMVLMGMGGLLMMSRRRKAS